MIPVYPGLRAASKVALERCETLIEQRRALIATRWSRIVNRRLLTLLDGQIAGAMDITSRIIDLQLAASSTDQQP